MNLLKREAAPQDMSTGTIQSLIDQGYDTGTWQTSVGATDYPCTSLNGRVWDLTTFLGETLHDAPIFSHSHVGCKCSLLVTSNIDTSLVPMEVIAYFF